MMFVTCTRLGRLGRLGNQLFQIAAVIGVARKNRCPFAFPFWRYATFFQHLLPQWSTLPITRPFVQRASPVSFQDIRVTGPTDLVGYFQSEKYFAHCEDEVRHSFTPLPASLLYLRFKFGAHLEKKTCSVHVRRGDYLANKWFADLSQGNYYQRALGRFDDDTTFLVFSDDIPWCREHFRGPRFVFVEGNQDIEDLFLMSLCRGHIIANSSFSWWGAWLDGNKDKVVVAPSRWFAAPAADPSLPSDPSGGPASAVTKDLIPPGWLVL